MKKILLLLFFSLGLVFPYSLVKAASCETPPAGSSPEKLQDIIVECQRVVDLLHLQITSLSQQISLMDNQIKITLLKISQTEVQMQALKKEIDALAGKIVRLDGSLNFLSKVLLSRVVETYKKGKIDPLILIISSKNFSEFLASYRYLQAVQRQDRQMLLAMEQTKTSYDEQKQLKEKIQADLTKLEKQLVGQKRDLAVQAEDKRKLLGETKGKEAEYQRILAAAQAEEETILQSMQAAILKLADGTKVEKGKEIALIGNTGYPCCSTGSHLHFMITTGCQRDDKGLIKNCNTVNPADFLKKISVSYDQNVRAMDFSGDWDWPIDSPRITQEYGMSYWARTGYYGGKPHNGIDMINENLVIRAPKGGTLYRQASSCGKCKGSCCATVNFVVLDHGDGVYSWYWHVK